MSSLNYQVPTPEDIEVAEKSSRLLAACIGKGEHAQLRLHDGDEVLEVPVKAVRLLVDILDKMAQGDAVSIVPVHKELTTQEVASLLNVSRPHVVKLLEEGAIPHHKVGVKRRVLFKDVMQYKEAQQQQSHALLDQLVADAQDMDMGY